MKSKGKAAIGDLRRGHSDAPNSGAEATDRKAQFIRQLAAFLVENQAGKGIALGLEEKFPHPIKWASEWAKLRSATPLFGYPTFAEAVRAMTEFLR